MVVAGCILRFRWFESVDQGKSLPLRKTQHEPRVGLRALRVTLQTSPTAAAEAGPKLPIELLNVEP